MSNGSEGNSTSNSAMISGIVLLAVWPLLMSSAYQMRIFTIVGIFALLSLGYQFIFGHAGALALTQGTFFGLGVTRADRYPER